jgi:hypothetical protein
MYLYYFITNTWPQYKNNIWWKKYVTQLQMVSKAPHVVALLMSFVRWKTLQWTHCHLTYPSKNLEICHLNDEDPGRILCHSIRNKNILFCGVSLSKLRLALSNLAHPVRIRDIPGRFLVWRLPDRVCVRFGLGLLVSILSIFFPMVD